MGAQREPTLSDGGASERREVREKAVEPFCLLRVEKERRSQVLRRRRRPEYVVEEDDG